MIAMRRYVLKKATVEVLKSNVKKIKPGIATMQDATSTELIKFSSQKEELLKELENYTSMVSDIGLGYQVEEYWVEETNYDGAETIASNINVLAYSEMVFTVYKDGIIPIYTGFNFNEILKMVQELNSRWVHSVWENGKSNLNIKQLREAMELSQSEFARYFGIPIRTLQEWENNRVPSYVINMMARIWDMEQGDRVPHILF